MNKVFRPSDFGKEVQAADALGDVVVAAALILAAIVMMSI